jgi:hypothetical protein
VSPSNKNRISIMKGNPHPDPINLNEDWLKTGYWDLPTDFDTFMNRMAPWAQTDAAKVQFLKDMIKLPSWYAAPVGIKKRAAELIGGR